MDCTVIQRYRSFVTDFTQVYIMDLKRTNQSTRLNEMMLN